MKPLTKIIVVIAGYIAAFLIAYAAVVVYAAFSNVPADQASGGMQAFGDSLFFLAVLGVASVPATACAFYFLKSHRLFWQVFSTAALVIAATGFAAGIVYVAARGAPLQSALHLWSALAVLRILLAPLCALMFLLSSFFAPKGPIRFALFAATVIEAAVFACVAFLWVFRG